MRHPIHPMLVHGPVACWLLVPLCDALAAARGADFFWQASALLAAFGIALGGLAAMAGAMDFAAAREKAPRLVVVHGTLMASAWAASAIGLAGRLGADRHALLPPPLWAVGAGVAALVLMVAGAWCGGEMVYGRGIGVRIDPPNQ